MSSSSPWISDWIVDIPFSTRLIGGICIIIQLSEWSLFSITNLICLNPYRVIYQFQLYRLLLSAFFHLGLLHIVMNLLTLSATGSKLEKDRWGSLSMILYTLLLSVLSSLIFVASSFSGMFSLHSCAVGFSGVLFSFITLLSLEPSNSTSRDIGSVIGISVGFSIPTLLYPWLMAIVMQILLPSASFLGHISGIIAAYSLDLGLLVWLERVIHKSVLRVETLSWWKIKKISCYASHPLTLASNQDFLKTPSSLLEWLKPVFSSLLCFFNSGAWYSQANSSSPSSSSSSSSVPTPEYTENKVPESWGKGRSLV